MARSPEQGLMSWGQDFGHSIVVYLLVSVLLVRGTVSSTYSPLNKLSHRLAEDQFTIRARARTLHLYNAFELTITLYRDTDGKVNPEILVWASCGNCQYLMVLYYSSKEDQPFISNIIIVSVRLALLLRAISNLLLLWSNSALDL